MGIPGKPQNSGIVPEFSGLLWKRMFVLESSSLFQNSVFPFLTVLTDYSTLNSVPCILYVVDFNI